MWGYYNVFRVTRFVFFFWCFFLRVLDRYRTEPARHLPSKGMDTTADSKPRASCQKFLTPAAAGVQRLPYEQDIDPFVVSATDGFLGQCVFDATGRMYVSAPM